MLEVVYDYGGKRDIRILWETWQQHRSYVVQVYAKHAVKSITLDPARTLPDHNRNNDVISMK